MSDPEVTCYCGTTMPASKLVSHFLNCAERKNSSNIYRLMECYWPSMSDGQTALFVEMELGAEMQRVKQRREELMGKRWDEAVEDRKVEDKQPAEMKKPEERKAERVVKPVAVEGGVQVKKEEKKVEEKKEFRQPSGSSRPMVKPPNPASVRCSNCSSAEGDLVKLDCSHVFCAIHITKVFHATFLRHGVFRCHVCQKPVLHKKLRAIVGSEVFDKVLEEINSPIEEDIECECGAKSHFRPSKVDYTLVDKYGEQYSREAAELKALSCFTCHQCNTTGCTKCAAVPYHDGLTCEQAELLANGQVCRYCERPAANGQCQRAECKERIAESCEKTLPCSHRCCGFKDESACLPCLYCPPDTAEQLCLICGTERLTAAPVVANHCGHMYHLHCLRTRLEKRWTGSRISFNFAGCPVCTQWTVPPEECKGAHDQFMQIFHLYEEIRDKAMERLAGDTEEHSQINDESSEYYNNPELYVMDRYCYYLCNRCKRPYFGGKKQCNLDEAPQRSSPEDMICLDCRVAAGAQSCPLHGNNSLAYKCRFCCSEAKYFCWGTSHQCEDCHQKIMKGDDMAKRPAAQLPQCKGRDSCPLKIEHPPTGTEFIIGCGICRAEKQG